MAQKVDELIFKANQRLNQANIGITIQRIGNALYLRGMLPGKTKPAHSPYVQQRIPLFRLGIRANAVGVKEAEHEAIKVCGLLARKEFSWEPYLKSEDKPQTIGAWIERFEYHYFSKRERNSKSETTWKGDYLAALRMLPEDEVISVEVLEKTILQTKPDTKTRKRCVMVYSKLAELAGLDAKLLKALSGNYSPRKVCPREVPDDETILVTQSLIDSPAWLWVYRVLATYGLRNHEVFFCDFSLFPLLRITEGKTGSRLVWPLYPEWAEQWNLQQMNLPNCTGKRHADLGHRVSQAFRRYNLAIKPYDLRHAWAIRSLRFGMDISLAASQMGHSVQVHTQIYHRWISQDTYLKAYESLLQNPNRPMPPLL